MTLEEAKERIGYNPETGEFTLLKHKRYPSLAGRKTACLDASGYVQINLSPYGPVKGHRLAWLLHYGEWPNGHIDHINGIRNDNRIVNLRAVSNAINCQNKRRPLPSNKTGWLGVTYDRGAYRAAVCHKGKQHHLGRFPTPELAHAAYVGAKRLLHEGCTL
jgi:hypothetical protein